MLWWIDYLLVFLSVALADVTWAFYIRKTAEGKAVQAAFLSVLIYFFAAYSFSAFIKNFYMLIPAGFGAFIGTYFTIKWDKKHGE